MRIGGAVVGGGVALLAVTLAVGAFWAGGARDAVMAKTWEVGYEADFPIPFPLTEAEIAALNVDPAGPQPDLGALATERAVARGKHLVDSRLGCADCHGVDFAGGTMVDAPPMGKLLGSNITPGGVTKGWGASEWDRIVRHGIMSDGHTAVMPAQDFNQLSDRELSDVVTYLRSVPASDAVIPAPTYGPVFTVLLAAGKVRPAAYDLDHGKVPPRVPPAEAPDVAYGAHVAQSCKGCHGPRFSGGPIQGGDPAWPPASNLTPAGMAGWTYDDFDAAVRKGQRKAGGEVAAPMPWKAFAKMSDVEVQAMWVFVQSLPPLETGVR